MNQNQQPAESFQVPAIYLAPLLQLCEEHQLDVTRLLASAGLSPRLLANDKLFMPQKDYIELLNQAARLSGDPLLGLTLGRRFGLDNIGAIGMLIAQQRNLLNAYIMLGYVLQSEGRAGRHLLVKEGRNALHCVEFLFADRVDCHQLAMVVLAAYNNIFSELLGSRWKPTRLMLTTPARLDISKIEDYFRCPVELGSKRDALEFPAQLLYRQLPTPTEAERHLVMNVARILRSFEDIEGLVRQFVLGLLPEGCSTKGDVAQALGVHPRVLQDCLEAAGTTFKSILTRVRMELACDYLQHSSARVADIAVQLNFSDSRSFVRAFKQWTGETPLQWRKRRQPEKRA